MKKIVLIGMLFVLTFVLSGCYNFSAGIINGQLLDVKVFDEDKNEIAGEFTFSRYENEFLVRNGVVKPVDYSTINSPAPAFLYYVADVKAYDLVLIGFHIKENNNRVFSHLRIDGINVFREDFHSIDEEDGGLWVYWEIDCTNQEVDFLNFYIQSILFTFGEEEGYRRGTTWQEGRTYISGVYLRLQEEEDDPEPVDVSL